MPPASLTPTRKLIGKFSKCHYRNDPHFVKLVDKFVGNLRFYNYRESTTPKKYSMSILLPLNIQFGFKTHPTVSQLLVHPKDTIPIKLQSYLSVVMWDLP